MEHSKLELGLKINKRPGKSGEGELRISQKSGVSKISREEEVCVEKERKVRKFEMNIND